MDPQLGPLKFGIIGTGTLGCTIGRALIRRGYEIVQGSSAHAEGRDRASHALGIPIHEDPVRASDQVDCVVISVPDDALPDVVHRLAQRPSSASPMQLRVISTSSDGGLARLDPLRANGHDVVIVHPMAGADRVTLDPDVFRGAGAAIGAHDEPSRVFAHAFASTLDLVPFDMSDDAWPLHAAACTAAATLVGAMFDVAEGLAQEADIDIDIARSAYGRLATGRISRCMRDGAGVAIGGPLARGDGAALFRQLEAVARAAPHAVPAVVEGLRLALARLTMSGRMDVARSHAFSTMFSRFEARDGS